MLELPGPRRMLRPEFEPDEQIVAAAAGLRAHDFDSCKVALRVRYFEVFAGEKEHHFRRQADPPVRGLDLADHRSIRFCGVLCTSANRPKKKGRSEWDGSRGDKGPVDLQQVFAHE